MFKTTGQKKNDKINNIIYNNIIILKHNEGFSIRLAVACNHAVTIHFDLTFALEKCYVFQVEKNNY